jgi:hypothetical protein
MLTAPAPQDRRHCASFVIAHARSSSGAAGIRPPRYRRSSVVVSGFQDLDLVIVCSVHEPMFVVDPPGPIPGQFPFEGFWFSNPCERVALDFSDKPGYPSGCLAVGG